MSNIQKAKIKITSGFTDSGTQRYIGRGERTVEAAVAETWIRNGFATLVENNTQEDLTQAPGTFKSSASAMPLVSGNEEFSKDKELLGFVERNADAIRGILEKSYKTDVERGGGQIPGTDGGTPEEIVDIIRLEDIPQGSNRVLLSGDDLRGVGNPDLQNQKINADIAVAQFEGEKEDVKSEEKSDEQTSGKSEDLTTSGSGQTGGTSSAGTGADNTGGSGEGAGAAGNSNAGNFGKNSLPEDFPFRDEFIKAGFDTVEKIRTADRETIIEKVNGVGEKNFHKIQARIANA